MKNKKSRLQEPTKKIDKLDYTIKKSKIQGGNLNGNKINSKRG